MEECKLVARVIAVIGARIDTRRYDSSAKARPQRCLQNAALMSAKRVRA
jgi:hypothetical protein